MGTAAHTNLGPYPGYHLSRHAWRRMSGRGFSSHAIRQVLDYGRVVHVRGATIHVVGRKEVEQHRDEGIALSGVEGVHVVCSDDGVIITVYRNHDFRGLHPRSRRAWRRSR